MFEQKPEELLCAVLRGESISWPPEADLKFRQDFFHAAVYHGVEALFYTQLKGNPAWDFWPADLREKLRSRAHLQGAQELARKYELIKVLGALADAGTRPLLMKGTPLAYTLYDSPALRDRGDTDLLIKKKDLEAACRVLDKLGYRRDHAVSGELISSQFGYVRRDRYGVTHELDVHWRISNFQLFGNLLTYDELESRAVSVHGLGSHARALGDAHALLLACIHRLGHAHAPYYVDGIPHYGANRLIWLYDIHLLGKKMTPGQWEFFVQTAQEKALRSFCFDGLTAASQAFGASFPQTVLQSLSAGGKGEDIPVSRLSVCSWKWLLSEFVALPGWRQRMVLLKEHLFPSGSYMLKKYSVDDRRLLPLLYLHRAVKGVWKYGT